MSTFLAVLAVSAFLLRICTDKGVATRTAEDAAIGADAWAKIVGVAADLRTAANVAALLNGKMTRLEQDGSQKHWKAEAFASTLSDVKLKERWHFLLLCLDGLIADNKRKHVLTTAALIEKTAQALHAAGHLGEFTKTVGRLLSGTNGCVCQTGAAGASCSAHYTAASPLPPVAPDKLGQVTEDLGSREHVTNKGFAKLGTSFGLNDNVQNNAGTGCKIFKRTDTEPNGAQGTAIDVPFAGGLLKRKGDDSEETLNLADLTTGDGANPTNLAKIPLMYEAWQALRDLTNAAQNAPEQTNLPTRADLAYNGKCQPHLMAAFKSEKKTDTDLTEQQYNNQIKQLFGEPSVDINEQFWKKLETATLNEQLLPRGSPKELKLIDDIAALMQASRSYQLHHMKQLAATTTSAQSPPQQPKITEIDCNKHQSQSDCKEPCKWNENDTEKTEKCSLDPKKAGEQQTAQTAGKDGATGGAAATTGCAKHGTKAECDADKKDDKQNCAWRKGKDGEDDKDTEKCRNGSFLFNRKLALMVSAFMNLL